jgi:hypothetical protein
MKQLSALRYGVALAVTVSVLYLACAIVTMISPTAIADMLGAIVHGLNINPLTRDVPPNTLGGTLIGLVYIACYSFVAGVLFGAIRNRLARSA